ncbi:MAG TPA: hypothetical protein VFW63_10600 [Acidimicrobiales bacterium]|nr:hypothetical protein [Acidimicrobiales bacterium]
MRRSAAVVAGTTWVALVLLALVSPLRPAGALAPAGRWAPEVVQQGADGPGDGTGATDEEPTPVPDQDIIPRPNSGHEPTEAGDRGGALQVLVLVAIVVGVATVAGLAVRDVRRSRARQGRG